MVDMFHCISLQKEGRTVMFPSLGGVVPISFFFCFVPNLLRKAVKVEGTQEGTKRSREQLDVIIVLNFIPHF